MSSVSQPRTRADELSRQLIGVGFNEFLQMGNGAYVPTFCGLQNGQERRRELADLFDAARTERGGPVSHRCHWGGDHG